MHLSSVCFCGSAVKMHFYAAEPHVQKQSRLFSVCFCGSAAKMCFYAAKPHVQKQLRQSRTKKMSNRVVSKCIYVCIFLLRPCRNYFYACDFAAQEYTFAAVPQNKDRNKMHFDTTPILIWSTMELCQSVFMHRYVSLFSVR